MIPGEPANEAQRVWLRLKAMTGAVRRPPLTRAPVEGNSEPYGRGRDPLAAGAVLDTLTDSLGWRAPLARTDLVAAWREIAGEEVARHAHVEAVEEGVLVVRCDSTAWATQLRIMRDSIAERIARGYPDAGVVSLRFVGPNTPSWNRGPRSVPGRGPRDTYG